MFVSMVIWIIFALVFPFYSANIAKLGVFLCLVAGLTAKWFNEKFIIEEDVLNLSEIKKKIFSSLVICMTLFAGGGLAVAPIIIINWTMSS